MNTAKPTTQRERFTRRVAAWWRWMAQPWRSFGLIVALIASFAVPAFMAASADVFRLSAADSITQQVVEDDPAGLDAAILASGRLDADGVAALDAATRQELARVVRLGEPARTVYVPGSDLGLQRPPETDGDAAEVIIGSGARFMARDGAVEALRVVEGDRSVDGVWISERYSDRLGLTAGDLVVVNDSEPVPIAGVFADLWDGERDPYWDELPAEVVPRFSRVFGGPLFEVIVVSESLLYSFGVDGVTRWDATVIEPVDSQADLAAHARQLRNVERSYTESDAMASAIAGYSGDGGPAPTLVTDTFDVHREADRIIADLDQPISTTALAGIVLGLLVTAAGAAFAVRRRQTEMRLLRADGDASWRFAARAIVQYAPAAAIGGVLGVVAGWGLVARPGQFDRVGWDVVELGPIAMTLVVGLLVAAGVTAVASGQLLATRRSAIAGLRPSWFLPVAGLAIAAWIQVGSAAATDDIDPLVVAFPLIGLVAGVGLAVIAAGWLMRRIHRTGGSLPPALFFAWRRITSAESAAVSLSAAMGVALGLIVFAATLVDSLETATEAKTTTIVGGETQAVLASRYSGDLPDSTTLVREQRTRLTIGGGPVTILAVDPATYADGVSWHRLFGSSADEVIRLLDVDVDADVAAVVAGAGTVPSDGGFGTSSVTSYEVVGATESVPLASDAQPTLIVRWDQVEEIARRQNDALRPPDIDPDVWAEMFDPPFGRYVPVVVSQLDARSLTAFLEANDIDVREVTTGADRDSVVTARAARWAFGYLGVLAIVSGVAAVGMLLFYLSEQRAARRLSSVMARRMGMRSGSDAAAEVLELLGLVSIAYIAGAATALLLAGRVFDRFEPDQRVPPDVGLDVSWPLLAVIAALGVGVVVVAALVSHRIAARRTDAEVLRGV